MRHRWMGFLVALAVLALLLWLARPVVPGEGRFAPPVVVEPPAFHPPPVSPRAAPVTEPAAARSSSDAVVAAIEALAEASGRTVVSCPRLPPVPPGRRREYQHPSGGTCATTEELICAVTQPAGTVVVRELIVVTLPDGSVSSSMADDGLSTLRWDTDADGHTRCTVEPPTPGQVMVRVVDASGLPLAGVGVLANDLAASTDADGRARLSVLTAGYVEVMAFGQDGGVSRPASVAAGGEVTLVLGPPPADLAPGEVRSEVLLARHVEAMGDLESALAEERRPAVAAELRRLLDAVRASVDAVCTSVDLPSCPAGR